MDNLEFINDLLLKYKKGGNIKINPKILVNLQNIVMGKLLKSVLIKLKIAIIKH